MGVFVFSTYPSIHTSVRRDGLRGPHQYEYCDYLIAVPEPVEGPL